MSYLFDTVALSEPGKSTHHAKAIAWIRRVSIADVNVSAVTVGELAYGILRMPLGEKRARLETWLNQHLLTGHLGKILPLDSAVAMAWARIKANATATPPLMDSLIAATALAHNLIVVTRNERDFTSLGVRIVNPWK